MTAGKRHLPVEGAFNIRDLGGYQTRAGTPIPWRRFLRSDSLHRIAPQEISRLHDEGLRAVIDLRCVQATRQLALIKQWCKPHINY